LNSTEESAQTVESGQGKAVKLAGIMFLFSFIVPTLNWALVLSRLVEPDDAVATANTIVANESLFRVGITIELVMSVGLVVLGVALYSILKNVAKNLAQLALAFKVVEATLSAAIVLASLFALQMLVGASSSTGLADHQLLASLGFLLCAHILTLLVEHARTRSGDDARSSSHLLHAERSGRTGSRRMASEQGSTGTIAGSEPAVGIKTAM
jgi:hypothetical protein